MWLDGSRPFVAKAEFTFAKISQPEPSPITNLICEASVQQYLTILAIMDGDKIEGLSGQPLPGATIPLDSNGAHSGDSEVKKRARSNSPNGEVVKGAAKRVKGVAPIKSE